MTPEAPSSTGRSVPTDQEQSPGLNAHGDPFSLQRLESIGTCGLIWLAVCGPRTQENMYGWWKRTDVN